MASAAKLPVWKATDALRDFRAWREREETAHVHMLRLANIDGGRMRCFAGLRKLSVHLQRIAIRR